MPFASKAEQRAARATDARSADRIVTSLDAPERNKMPQDKTTLTGGSLMKSRGAGKSNPLHGGNLGVSGKSSTITGCLNMSDGSSTWPVKTLRSDSPRNGGGTTREKLGRTGQTFTPQARKTSGDSKPDGKQGSHHDPDARRMGKKGY